MSDVQRVELEPAYILHARAYRETSQLVEALTRNHGRIGLVARGARGNRSRWGGSLQPFQAMHLSWSGRGTLCTLRSAEPAGPPLMLGGASLMSAWYANELLLALTTRGDPHPELFAHYAAALAGLADPESAEIALRSFELALLADVGYALATDRDIRHGAPLDPAGRYEYLPDRGAMPAAEGSTSLILTGAQLQAIASGDFSEAGILKLAKRLLRGVLAYHLGDRRLRTRDVFAAMQRKPAG